MELSISFFFCYITFTVLLVFGDSATTGAAVQSPVVILLPEVVVLATRFCRQSVAVDVMFLTNTQSFL